MPKVVQYGMSLVRLSIRKTIFVGVRSINFVGNQAYSAYRLRNIMQTTEMNYLSWFKNTDVYDPDRIASDQELIRRFYLKNGYADFRIVGSEARYDDAAKGYIVTITVDEGRQYRVGNVRVESNLNGQRGVAAKIETISVDEADATYDRVVDGKVHFRAVIDTATFAGAAAE
mgnify:CR=1 FL=1